MRRSCRAVQPLAGLAGVGKGVRLVRHRQVHAFDCARSCSDWPIFQTRCYRKLHLESVPFCRLSPFLSDMSDASTNIGFIGLGVMGYPMARNLLLSLPTDSNFYVFDVSLHALRKFEVETNNDRVIVCNSCRQVAEGSVSTVPSNPHTILCSQASCDLHNP